jgi:phosphate transport system substrate-binding protein
MVQHTLRGPGKLELIACSACLAASLLIWPSLARAADTTLAETGSTLMLPLLQSWAEGYGKVAEDVKITTAGTGSGAGIAAAIEGTVQIGASDAYMSDVEVMQHAGVLNIPLAISAQTVNYNLADLAAPLKLSGPVLAGIYAGTIRDWSDSQIAALNPGVTLPHHAIVPIRRAEASGDTFIFTQFLTFSTPEWETGPGYGTTVNWPGVSGMLTASGNDGMVQSLGQTPYGIGYVGASFADQVSSAKLGVAQLLNESGKFVLPTPGAVAAAAASLTPRTPADQRLTLVFAPGDDSYPLINYDYAIVRTQQANPDQAAALRSFLLWIVTPGQGTSPAYLDPLHFIALPTAIRALSETQIAKLH